MVDWPEPDGHARVALRADEPGVQALMVKNGREVSTPDVVVGVAVPCAAKAGAARPTTPRAVPAATTAARVRNLRFM
jgi:hypothetical protein